MRIILHRKNGGRVLLNENWTHAAPATDAYYKPNGTMIWWGEKFIEVRESFDEFCEAMKASRRFSRDSKSDNPVPDV